MNLALIASELERVVPDAFDGAAARFASAIPRAVAFPVRLRSA